MTDIQATIITIIRERQRGAPPSRGVYPCTITCYLDFFRHEATLRKDCNVLWQQGYLDRPGGKNARRGYRVAVQPIVVPCSKPQRPIIQWIPPISQLIRVA